MTQVPISCPYCSSKGFIEVLDDSLKDVSRGILTININKKICEHSFITYLDKNFNVRDYFITDFQIELPDITPTTEAERKEVPGKDLINSSLIKRNLHALLITFIIKSIFMKEKIVLINDSEFVNQHILNFFNYITQDSFKIDISIVSKEDYLNNKEEYQDSLIFDVQEIMEESKKVKSPKELKIERLIVQKFFTSEETTSLIVIKNEFQKAYELSVLIKEYIENQKGAKVYTKKIIDYIENKHSVKISVQYLNFLIEIVKKYFNIHVRLHLSNLSGMW